MKVVIDIPELDYECAKQRWMRGNSAHQMDYYISNGIPLDDVLAEIKGEIKKDASKWVGFGYGDGIATALEIIDKYIGKAEKGGE